MTKTTFFYKGGQENVYTEQGVEVFDLIEDILSQITDPNIVLGLTITTEGTYLATRKYIEDNSVKKAII